MNEDEFKTQVEAVAGDPAVVSALMLTLAGTAGNSRPTVLHTAGYALERYNNRLDQIARLRLVNLS